ncbi:MAG TPA: transposase [Gaiellaceae bacterium]|nr:transposase [Gaiellaceae bacterium]
MSRTPRIEQAGLTYHVTGHGLGGIPLYRCDDDRGVALELLVEEIERSAWTCLEYCFMSTHYHLVIELQKPTLSSGFHSFNGRYARYFNRTYGRRGHAFEDRYRARLVETDLHRLEVVRYVARNPVKANMCELPEDYPWSGYGSIIGLHAPDPAIDIKAALAPFGGSRRAYRMFVEEKDPRVRRCQANARHRKSRAA